MPGIVKKKKPNTLIKAKSTKILSKIEDSLHRKVEKYSSMVLGFFVSIKIGLSTSLCKGRIKTLVVKFKVNIEFQWRYLFDLVLFIEYLFFKENHIHW